jgi:hypothetical protein
MMRSVTMRAVVMMNSTIMGSFVALRAAAMTLAAAAEQPVSLKQAPGVDKVEANCAASTMCR